MQLKLLNKLKMIFFNFASGVNSSEFSMVISAKITSKYKPSSPKICIKAFSLDHQRVLPIACSRLLSFISN